MLENMLEKVKLGSYNLPVNVQSDLIRDFANGESVLIGSKILTVAEWGEKVKTQIGTMADELWRDHEIEFLNHGTTKDDVTRFVRDAVIYLIIEVTDCLFVNLCSEY